MLATPRRRTARAAASVLATISLGLGAAPLAALAAPALAHAAEPATVDPETDPVPGAAEAALASLGTGGRDESATRLWLAALVAERSSAEPVELDAIWAKTPAVRLRAVYSALSQVGVRYRTNAMTAGEGLDCSGLTSWSWSQAGVAIPHSSKRQINGAAPREPDALLPGDLVYNPGHVAMYLGHAQAIVESPYSGKLVRVLDWKQNATLRYGSPLAEEPAAVPVLPPALANTRV